jgi:hypothetical protein
MKSMKNCRMNMELRKEMKGEDMEDIMARQRGVGSRMF